MTCRRSIEVPRPRWPRAPISATALSFVNDAERSRALHTSLKRDLSHGSESGKPHSRARLQDLDLAWLHTRSGRSALACGRARNLNGIHDHAPPASLAYKRSARCLPVQRSPRLSREPANIADAGRQPGLRLSPAFVHRAAGDVRWRRDAGASLRRSFGRGRR
jgi:hypothetical protein